MSDEELMEEAQRILDLLPRVMRGLFAIESDDPGMVLPAAQLRVCLILMDGHRPMSSLGKELRISLSAITQIADRLEKAGFVERIPEADDRRVKVLQLTKRGMEMMSVREERRRERVFQAIHRLCPESREVVIKALKILLEAGLATAEEYVDEAETVE
jgi:DNA-binding MarR family transcriptional regulator